MPEDHKPTNGVPAQPQTPPASNEQIDAVPLSKSPEPKDFIGLTLEKAQALAKTHKLRHRVVMIDGKPLPVTRDHRPERLNFTVEKGKVTKVTKG